MKIIAANETEAIELASVLQRAAGSVMRDMTIHEIEQGGLSAILCTMRDSIEIKEANHE